MDQMLVILLAAFPLQDALVEPEFSGSQIVVTSSPVSVDCLLATWSMLPLTEGWIGAGERS
jgi:hypothetical protein